MACVSSSSQRRRCQDTVKRAWDVWRMCPWRIKGREPKKASIAFRPRWCLTLAEEGGREEWAGNTSGYSQSCDVCEITVSVGQKGIRRCSVGHLLHMCPSSLSPLCKSSCDSSCWWWQCLFSPAGTWSQESVSVQWNLAVSLGKNCPLGLGSPKLQSPELQG